MNVIRVYGGIGNQMFQYAFGRAQQANGIDVYYDISWMQERELRKQAYPRPARLDKFQAKYKVSRLMRAPKVREHFIFDSLGKVGYDLKLLKMDGYNFDGYWQYLSYFEHLLPELKQELKLKPEVYTHTFLELRNIIRESNSVSVHVRRGDYLTHKGNFRDLPIDYYYDAIKLIKGNLFIFSDDIKWCRERFVPELFNRKITFVSLEDYLDFELMRECKNNITTNSTFSYWAALLNDNPDKVVICPKYWLMERTINDLHYPKEWIKIEDYVIQ